VVRGTLVAWRPYCLSPKLRGKRTGTWGLYRPPSIGTTLWTRPRPVHRLRQTNSPSLPTAWSQPPLASAGLRSPPIVNTFLQRKAAVLKRTEAKLRLRRRIQREYGNPRSLSPKERARLTSHLGETMYPNRTEGEISVQGSREREDSGETVPGLEAARRMSERLTLRETNRSGSSPGNSGSEVRPTADLPDLKVPSRTEIDLPDPRMPERPRPEQPESPRQVDNSPSASGPSGTSNVDSQRRLPGSGEARTP